MPEGEGPRPTRSDVLGPNPITHTPDGRFRRRNNPHGMTPKEQAWTYFDRGAIRLDQAVSRISGRKKNRAPKDDGQDTVKELVQTDAVAPLEDPFRYGSDISPLTIKTLRVLNRIGEFIDRLFAKPIIDTPPTALHPTQASDTPQRRSSVRIIPNKPKPPYDWADEKS